MTYSQGRIIVDADSHLMEWPSFLTEQADPAVRDALPVIAGGQSGLEIRAHGRAPGEREKLAALGDALIREGPKWHAALGAMETSERAQALDLLGFRHQVVFSSFCAPLFSIADPRVRYGAYRAHNRAMAAFCNGDARLRGVAIFDLDEPELAEAELREALRLGLKLAWLPARAPGGRSPGHPAHERIWSLLAEARVPFVLHVGSGAMGVGAEWMNSGRAAPQMGVGAEIIGSKDLMVIYQPIERFLSVLILDGVLERHPTLRGGAIEVGAGWAPDMLRRLDHAVSIWSRSEPELRNLKRKPSEQAHAQLRFTPYPFEDAGALIRESDPRLYLFSSDYPHAEGGRNPLGRFESSLAEASAATQHLFFAANAAEWMGVAI